MDTCLRLRGLTKHYDTGPTITRAVDGIDLDITRGEIVALLGANGAGKTTTLDMVLGFVEPTEGEIEVFGKDPARRCPPVGSRPFSRPGASCET